MHDRDRNIIYMIIIKYVKTNLKRLGYKNEIEIYIK